MTDVVPVPEEGAKSGVCFYDLPQDLNLEAVDPLIRPAVEKINASGWVWTAESCQGHPDATDPVWASNVRPMLRLVCRAEHEGAMWRALLSAARSMAVAPDDEENLTLWGRPATVALEVYPDERGQPDWCEALVYVPASTAWGRNRGILAFERFGEILAQVGEIARGPGT